MGKRRSNCSSNSSDWSRTTNHSLLHPEFPTAQSGGRADTGRRGGKYAFGAPDIHFLTKPYWAAARKIVDGSVLTAADVTRIAGEVNDRPDDEDQPDDGEVADAVGSSEYALRLSPHNRTPPSWLLGTVQAGHGIASERLRRRREVLTNNNMATTALVAAVAITTIGQVWKLVRRYRELLYDHAEQLRLPLRRPELTYPADMHRGARLVSRPISPAGTCALACRATRSMRKRS